MFQGLFLPLSFSLLLLLSFPISTTSITMMKSNHPYRAGYFPFSNLVNSTITFTLYNAYPSGTTLLPVIVSISSLSYNNQNKDRILIKVQPYNYSSTVTTQFYLKLTVYAALVFSQINIRYFLCKANDDYVFTTYLQVANDQGTLIENNTVANTLTYKQDMIQQYNATAANAVCFPLDVVCTLNKILMTTLKSLVQISDDNGIGKALYGGDTSSQQYTQIKSFVFFNKLNFKYSGSWKIKVESKSNRLDNLTINVTYSNTISELSYNCSIILFNSSSSPPAGFKFYMLQYSFTGEHQKFYAENEEMSSQFLMIGLSSIGLINGSKSMFEFIPEALTFLSFYSYQPYNQYIFQSFGTIITQPCSDPSTPYAYIIAQSCLSSCPSGLYPNATLYCKQCIYPCDICSSSVDCLSCDYSNNSELVLENSRCIQCGVGRFKHGSICSNCGLGCLICTSSTYCTSCDAGLKMILVGNQCVQCSIGTYFDNLLISCQLCKVGCLSCQSYTVCTTCDSTNRYYLSGYQCLLCPTESRFLNSSTSSCQYCSSGCIQCQNSTTCIECNSSLSLILNMDSQCIQCSPGTYYDLPSKSCKFCQNNCLTCQTSIKCLSCDQSVFTLINYQCLNCSDPIYSILCPSNKVFCLNPLMTVTLAKYCQFRYYQQVSINFDYNTMIICSQFNISNTQPISKLTSNYNLAIYLNNHQITYTNFRTQNQNKICVNYQFSQSFTKHKLQVLFVNQTNTNSIINPRHSETVTGAYFPPLEKQTLTKFGEIIDAVMQNSGSGFSALAASFSISLFVGFIEFIEITSLYMYLEAPIPYNLKIMFQNLMSAQQFSLLPFNIPNPMQSDQLTVTGDKVYSQYAVDLYFMRGNCVTIFQTLFWICLYCSLYFIIRSIKCKNKGFKFVSIRLVNRFYANCIVCIEAIQIFIVFSGAAAMTSRSFVDKQTTANYFTSSLFTFFAFVLPILNTIFLVKYKNNSSIDTDDAYPTIERNRKGAQLYTALRLFGLLSSAMMIPLFPYIYTVVIVIILLIFQLIILFERNLFKYRVMCWFRILHTILFILFNLIYTVYWIIDRYYPHIEVDVLLKFGTASIGSLFGIYLLDIAQAVVDIGDIIYQNFQKLFCKKKKKQIEEQQNAGKVKLGGNLKFKQRKGIRGVIEPFSNNIIQSKQIVCQKQLQTQSKKQYPDDIFSNVKYQTEIDIGMTVKSINPDIYKQTEYGFRLKSNKRKKRNGVFNQQEGSSGGGQSVKPLFVNMDRVEEYNNEGSESRLDGGKTGRNLSKEKEKKEQCMVFKTDPVRTQKKRINRDKIYDAAMELKQQRINQMRGKQS